MTCKTAAAIEATVGKVYGSPLSSGVAALAFQGTTPYLRYVFEGATKLNHCT